MDEIKAELKAKWEALTLPMKILAILGAPLILGYVILRIVSTISALFNSAARTKTDAQETKLSTEATAINQNIAKEEGHLEATKEQGKEALNEAQKVPATDFFDSRYGDPDKQ